MDFTNCGEIYSKTYDGAGGGKRCIVIDGEEYMLKFPQTPTKKTELSYTNSCVSEYIGCHIFELAEIPVQKTILGTYITEKGKEKIAVACKDFTFPHKILHTFTGLKNQVVDSSENGKGTELSAIMDAIESQKIFPPEVLKERFWDMFVVDALIGNWDRHNGNWGYMRDLNTNEVSLAPVFDCAGSLFSQSDEKQMRSVLASRGELNQRVYSNPFSAIRMDEKKINYMEFINSLENEDCNRSLKKICPKLSADKIKEVVNATPYITDLQKDFYNAILEARFELILKTAYKKLLKREQETGLEKTEFTVTVNAKEFGEKYIAEILKNTDRMSFKEAVAEAYDKLVDASPAEKNARRQMLNAYLKSAGIKNNTEFEEFISLQKKKQNMQKDNDLEKSSKSKKSRDYDRDR